MRVVRIVAADPDNRYLSESVEYAASEVSIRHKPEGVSITPRHTTENDLGFHSLFFPWAEIRQIKEYERG